jgi:hypothetical protein
MASRWSRCRRRSPRSPPRRRHLICASPISPWQLPRADRSALRSFPGPRAAVGARDGSLAVAQRTAIAIDALRLRLGLHRSEQRSALRVAGSDRGALAGAALRLATQHLETCQAAPRSLRHIFPALGACWLAQRRRAGPSAFSGFRPWHGTEEEHPGQHSKHELRKTKS